jgi:serine/threonine-protein kinase
LNPSGESAWAESRAGRVLARRYRLDLLLGVGGMGAVFAATHLAVGRAVAVKMLRPELAQDHATVSRFHAEARAAAAVARRGVVDVLDFDVDPELGPFLVMERLIGEPLSARIARGRLAVEEAAQIGGSVLSTLAAVHGRGIVHRDLKPANVFLARDDDGSELVKVLDFGISRFEGSSRVTRTGALLGTPSYMAPEQARDGAAADPRIDLYAVGAILYEAMAGRPPYEGESAAEIVALVLTSPPPPIASLRPDVPDALARVIETAMAPEPERRFPTAHAMHDALVATAIRIPVTRELAAVTASGPATAPPPPPAPVTASPAPTERRSAPRGLVAGAAAIIALLAGALAVVTVIAARRPGAGPAAASPPVATTSPAFLETVERADAARRAGRLDEAAGLYEGIAAIQPAFGSADAHAVGRARIALGDLRAAAIVPYTAARDHVEAAEQSRALANTFTDATTYYSAAMMLGHLDIDNCALLGTARASERVADAYERAPMPGSIEGPGVGSYRASQRSVARIHLELAVQFLARTVVAPGSEPDACRVEAVALRQRLTERLASWPR